MLLSSVRAASNDTELIEMRPQTKKLCRAESAADVMGPVERGERMMAKKGARRSGKGTVSISVQEDVSVVEMIATESP